MRVGRDKIAVEREDTISLAEIGHQSDPFATDLLSFECLITVKLGTAELPGKFLGETASGRTHIGAEHKSNLGGTVSSDGAKQCLELRAVGSLAFLEHLARTVGCVKIEHRGLSEHIGAVGIRMQRVGSQFGRATLEGGDHQGSGACGTRHGGSVVGGLSRDHPLG